MKRHIVLFLTLTMLLLGCSHSPEPTEPPTQSTLPPASTEPAPTPSPLPEGSILPTEAQTLPTETTEPEAIAPVLSRPEPADEDFVRILDYLPSARQALAYATEDNFTGHPIYEFSDAWLRYGTVKKLMAVSRELEKLGYTLLIWDGFRPVSAQFALWEVFPDPTYVANPETGYSSHSRGNTVDLTLLTLDGSLVEMPTGFDDFSPLADRDYSDCTDIPRENAMLLETIMEEQGFSDYFGEWWHFSDTDSYPVETGFTPITPVMLYADCNEYITLRTAPDTAAQEITRIPREAQFQALAESGDFFCVDYQGLRGYVLKAYTIFE